MHTDRFKNYNHSIKEELISYDFERWARCGWKTIKVNRNIFSYIYAGCYLNFLRALSTYWRWINNKNAVMELTMQELNDKRGLQ